jgi:3-oxoacyl-[acyl-carrier protein] reductase
VDLGLKGRRALVMGGSRGLGRAIATGLKQEGAAVSICARDEATVKGTAAAIGAEGFSVDLSVDGAGQKVVADARQRLGGLDVLIVNTGGPTPGTFATLTDSDWRKGWDGLWMSTVQSIREALGAMRAQKWGRIIVVTSTTAREPVPNLMLSNALRAGLHNLINSLSKDVAADGVTVNALMPGYIATDRLKSLGLDEAALRATIPARRIGRPEEFAATAVFLASEAASYITGQAIAVDGGRLNGI